MALYQDLPVFADVYELTRKILVVTRGFPSGVQVHAGPGHETRRAGVVAQHLPDQQGPRQGRPLEGFLDDFELLKLEIRLSADQKLISVRKQGSLAELSDRIGRQITGWRNASLKARVPAVTAAGSVQ